MKKTTAKQILFSSEFPVDFNATQAAIRAGYSKKTARSIGAENLTKPVIRDLIAKCMEKRIESANINAKWVLDRAVEFHNRCAQSVKVTDKNGDAILDKDGRPIYSFEHTGVGKSLEIIGKHVDVQAFKEKVDHNHKFNDMTNEEIDARLSELSNARDKS